MSKQHQQASAPSQPAKSTAGEQYFTQQPSSNDNRRILHIQARSYDLDMEVSNGVFSTTRLDLGTSVLLKHAPTPQENGYFLDLGCGWGPISVVLGLLCPQAYVQAVDINERALALTQSNARRNNVNNIHTSLADDVLQAHGNEPFIDLLWSNPPIRIGKEALHTMLMNWLPLLKPQGSAYLVVQKNLGADSLIPWLAQALGDEFRVSKYASSKGYRIIEVLR